MTAAQNTVTVRAFVRADQLSSLEAALGRTRLAVEAGTSALGEVGRVHFCRFLVLPGTRMDTGDVQDSLMYQADVDGTAADHLDRLADRAGPVLDDLFGWCVDYPGSPDKSSRRSWLAGHQVRTAAHYVNTSGLGLDQILEEARLHDWLQAHLDAHRPDLAELEPAALHGALRAAVQADPGVQGSVRPPPAASLSHRLREFAHAATVVGVVIIASPLLLVVGVPWILALRRLEKKDEPGTERPERAAVERLRLEEDQFAYNPFAAMGELKPGRLRRATVNVVLRAIAFTTRHVFDKGDLAGVNTIHFARWVVLDDQRRVIFTSCYDGSLESYMDDFIDKLSWGLNIVFSNGAGYPRTRWLVLGGAKDEQAFKDYLRCHQLGNPVSWSAYPSLTTANILDNAEVRRGLSRNLGPDAARTWLARL